MKKIFVTGATGTVGSEVVHALKQLKANFVAGLRDPEKGKQKLGTDTPAVRFDFADPSSFKDATEGIDTVFLLGPPLDNNLDKLLTPFIDFLKAKKILRVVYLSAFGIDKISDDMPFHQNVQNKLKVDGFKLTVVSPTFFAQNFKNYEGENIVDRKILYGPAGNGKTAFVDIRDVGEVIAKLLTENGHEGKNYILTGPKSVSFSDVAEILTEIRKEKILYPAPTPEQYTKTLKDAGAPDFIAPYMIKVYSMLSKGHVDYVSPTIQQLLRKEPTPIQVALERYFK